MDIKQIIQHQDTLIALSASGRLYRLGVASDHAQAVELKVHIVGPELPVGEACALLAKQAH